VPLTNNERTYVAELFRRHNELRVILEDHGQTPEKRLLAWSESSGIEKELDTIAPKVTEPLQ
jgi:hypothetical protein